jgi:hypothetical protein
MKKTKPSKQAAIHTKNESNKGDYKGTKSLKAKTDTEPLKQSNKGYPAAKNFSEINFSEREVYENYIDQLLQLLSIVYQSLNQSNIIPENIIEVMENFKGENQTIGFPNVQSFTEKFVNEYLPKIKHYRSVIDGEQKGANATKQAREKRYQMTKTIFLLLEKKGEIFPIKRSEIKNTVLPHWPVKEKYKCPGEKTLFDYQEDYMNEKSKG